MLQADNQRLLHALSDDYHRGFNPGGFHGFAPHQGIEPLQPLVTPLKKVSQAEWLFRQQDYTMFSAGS